MGVSLPYVVDRGICGATLEGGAGTVLTIELMGIVVRCCCIDVGTAEALETIDTVSTLDLMGVVARDACIDVGTAEAVDTVDTVRGDGCTV